ncbi:uncharacterized protein MKK02DRAFT_45421 [Dioszegia hungarica]|uniref:Essential protein Yae1 N-terminal domain-containing protein n=1 Tax=Dioszegia hungarica TaxID=4972 RepID=A0AA38HD31_9TREE|nr:uncharacterized protein MKK02DRAFT_45421 [Dioszegia hungarica]KAI9636716.1 hypothetical protein MKK02DRAFT_45421 [Dioszegia hungarica]
MDIDASYSFGRRGEEMEDVWDETLNLETKFYQEGYADGHAHGQLHGLYEGRELGQEKAWEVWEEVGYMEGFALFWVDMLAAGEDAGKGRSKDARAISHARQLLALIETFPTTNPTTAPATSATATSASAAPATPSSSSDQAPSSESAPALPDQGDTEPDLILLLSSIRARYKLLCSSLGVRPRLLAAAGKDGSSGAGVENDGDVQVVVQTEGVVQEIEGPMKGVDTRMLRY